VTAEHTRLREARDGRSPWRLWGPYVSNRQWGTVREDYSPDGSAWASFPHDHARSRAYRWGEDGLAGWCDKDQRLCLTVALWNGRDPILKERLFGLTNEEGNHGEDAKELWWHVDAVPSHAWNRMLYAYPQRAYPYDTLASVNHARSRLEAVKAAKKHGTIVSYDLNYRPSLWKSIGGQAKAREVNREIAKHVDVMIGNEEDFTASLGFEVEGVDHDLSTIETDAFKRMIETAVKEYPNFKVAATTLRRVITASRNDWSAICWHDGKFHESRKYPELDILDRVGGGDSFASGISFGFLEKNDPQAAVDYGAAHGALASTTPGDTSMATRKEVEKLMKGGSARVVR
jgi:2-dehydro-3-deoxygluconokinase